MGRKGLGGSLTIRLSSPLQSRLRRRAAERHQTPSEVVRIALERALAEDDIEAGPTLGERTSHLVGSLASKRVPPGRDARTALGDWAPDRRG